MCVEAPLPNKSTTKSSIVAKVRKSMLSLCFYFPLDTNREGENPRWGKKRNSKTSQFSKGQGFIFSKAQTFSVFLWWFSSREKMLVWNGERFLFVFYGMLMFWVEWSVEEKE
jgi:hypothetical protein